MDARDRWNERYAQPDRAWLPETASEWLVKRGVPFKTPTYLVGEHLIWGATARILSDLLERL